MPVTKAELRKLFHVGESIATGGGRSKFEFVGIEEDCVKIKPTKGTIQFRLAYDKLDALLARARSIEEQIAQHGRVERAVGMALKEANLFEAQREVYLLGFVRQILVRRAKTMPITHGQTKASYTVAARVYAKEIGSQAGAQFLHDRHGMNLNSARDYIEVYKHMREGALRNRWLSASATEYFFLRIKADNGPKALSKAVESTLLYINHKPGKTLISLRDVVERFSQTVMLVDLEAKFAVSVESSAKDSPVARLRRLQIAAKVPLKVKATTYVFRRNPDVVVEVLLRAAGVCEGCRQAAPFLRKKDGTPYLEVHHTVQLISGGQDTVDNAVALCPNCHRRFHFGCA